MSDTLDHLRHKIKAAGQLGSVVRTMKAIAAASIGQYEGAVAAMADYYRTVELGLSVCYRHSGPADSKKDGEKHASGIDAVVFGSDQGLVGQFNDVLASFVASTLEAIPAEKRVWAVGERMHAALADAGLPPAGLFAVPSSVAAITPLIGQILLMSVAQLPEGKLGSLVLFHNRPKHGALYEPASQRLLPLDKIWQHDMGAVPWPTGNVPETIGDVEAALIREYLFVSLFRACAESLAAENASRLAAMQRAEKNIEELLDDLHRSYNLLRQSSIDDELFDVISGFEALTK